MQYNHRKAKSNQQTTARSVHKKRVDSEWTPQCCPSRACVSVWGLVRWSSWRGLCTAVGGCTRASEAVSPSSRLASPAGYCRSTRSRSSLHSDCPDAQPTSCASSLPARVHTTYIRLLRVHTVHRHVCTVYCTCAQLNTQRRLQFTSAKQTLSQIQTNSINFNVSKVYLFVVAIQLD